MALESTTLVMSPDNPFSTTFTDESGEAVYTVVTEQQEKNSLTHVRAAGTGKVLASLIWKDVTPSAAKVSFHGSEEFVGFNKWMEHSHVPFNNDVHFKAPDGNTYKWTGNFEGGVLCLWNKDDKEHPLARFYKSQFVTEGDAQSLVKAKLVIDTRADEIQDMVVASFVFLEKFRRARDFSSPRRVGAMSPWASLSF